MNCTEQEFRDKVWGTHPNKPIRTITEANGRFAFAHNYNLAVFCGYDLKTKISASDFVWYAGSVIKDADGLFASLVTPGIYTVGSGGSGGTYTSPAKCECGAHSVGSNRHSGYCPLDKENS